MGIRLPWTAENLREIARIHYLRDCAPSRPISCRSTRRVKSTGMANQNSYVPVRIAVDTRYHAYVIFFPGMKFLVTSLASFFIMARLESCVIACGEFENKKINPVLAVHQSIYRACALG